ncbi:uncharacterized protein PAE49_006045 [Odontesthes bonariensis]
MVCTVAHGVPHPLCHTEHVQASYIESFQSEHSVPFTQTQTERPQSCPHTPISCRCCTTPTLPSALSHITSANMIIRLGRLTPGYFRLLQRQVAGEVQTQPQDRAVNQLAMMLAIMGLSLSYYSAKQMTEKVQAQPAP